MGSDAYCEDDLFTSFGSILGSMKSKTSITLSRALLDDLDRVLGDAGNRSQLIEKALRDYLDRIIRETRERRDLEILNGNAGSLNKEAKEVLTYQVKK